MFNKNDIRDIAIFGGTPLFSSPRSTSNLVRPDVDSFFSYSRLLFDRVQEGREDSLVELLERELADLHKTKFCVAFSNGFWGLALAIKCLALPDKSEIVMPSLTYRRLADIAAWANLIPHFCEVEASTLGISPLAAERCINENTALLLGVHPIVNCCDADGMVDLAARTKVPLLFDSVESAYESCGGKKVGSFGNAECFSMHASKLINGFEGGYLTTDDGELAARLVQMRDLGQVDEGRPIHFGIDAAMNAVHAAMALAGLRDLQAQVERNRGRYHIYQQLLKSLSGIELVPFDEGEQCSFKNIVVRLTPDWPLSREDTLRVLHGERIVARPYYSPALHMKHAVYPTIAGDLTLSERLSEQFMLLPCGYFVDDEDTELIVGFLRFVRDRAGDITRQLRQ